MVTKWKVTKNGEHHLRRPLDLEKSVFNRLEEAIERAAAIESEHVTLAAKAEPQETPARRGPARKR